MADINVEGLSLPGTVQQDLNQLCRDLESSLGDNLVSLILYGSLVHGEYTQDKSDANIIVVLNDVSIDALDEITKPYRNSQQGLRASLMVLTEDDLNRSTDVFPAKFLDIRDHHHVLTGKDVVSGMEISSEHVRLRLEQEIKNLLLRLRMFYLKRALATGGLQSILTHGISSFIHNLATLLRLKKGEAPEENRKVIEEAAEVMGLEAKPMLDALALKSGSSQLSGDALRGLYGEFLETVEKAAKVVDGME